MVPRLVQNSTRRSSTAKSGSSVAALGTASQLRVERLAQAVADQVEAEHREHDRDAGDDRQEGRRYEVVVRVASASSPTPAWLDPAAPRPRKPRPATSMIAVAIASVALDDHRRDGFGMMCEKRIARLRTPTGARGEHEVALALREDRAAQEPGEDRTLTIPTAIMICRRPGPSSATMPIANRSSRGSRA